VERPKYSDQLVAWLNELGYTHCFFLAGGNIMHFLHSASQVMECVPFAHEVTAGIAAEYFNELSGESGSKAFVLVTAGPGLTNVVTAIAGAFLESRDLLVIGGQVKTSDLASGHLRQRGIQEINGSKLVEGVCKESRTLTSPINEVTFKNLVKIGLTPRKGPIFIEVPLDVQAAPPIKSATLHSLGGPTPHLGQENYTEIFREFLGSKRPVLILGGGLSREFCSKVYGQLQRLNVPIMTTWNGADRFGSEEANYWGRPNTWGQRYSNILIQQADYVLAIGTRLGLQQTGFNWKDFATLAKLICVDIDPNELKKGHPHLTHGICTDANHFLSEFLIYSQSEKYEHSEWLQFGQFVKSSLPLSESSNPRIPGFVNPYDFMVGLSGQLGDGDIVIPSSSGSAMTVAMQALRQPRGCRIVTNKSLASMGYGLGGAIGASLLTGHRVIHIEGDGGFLQNIQDLGTVRKQKLPIKTFILSNGGYASIRMTQLNYFGGSYIGCDEDTGLGLPDWELLAKSFGLNFYLINPQNPFDSEVLSRLNNPNPEFFVVPVSQDQTYFPKISSRITIDGSMESNPLHLMTPDLTSEQDKIFLKYLNLDEWSAK
jgi:acetolactate synthase-1/2/3 large subunit